MFYITKDKKRIVDSNGSVVGFIKGTVFSQRDYTRSGKHNDCSPIYNTTRKEGGLSAMELEQISEIMQKNGCN